MKKRRGIFSLLFLVCCLFFSAQSVFAYAPLEVQYPPLPLAAPLTSETTAPEYVRYVFYFAIAISGFIALGALIWAGFNWLTSTGLPEKKKEAQSKITSALVGLVILFSSWLILYTINPDIIKFRLPDLAPSLPNIYPGIYLCKTKPDGGEVNVAAIWDAIKEIEKTYRKLKPEQQRKKTSEVNSWLEQMGKHCWYVSSSTGRIPSDFEDKASYIYTVPSNTQRFGAILYEESDYKDAQNKASHQVIYKLRPEAAGFKIELEVSSIGTFILNDYVKPSWYAQIFELPGFEEKDETGKERKVEKYPVSNTVNPFDLYEDFPVKIEGPPSDKRGHQFQSVKIEGQVFAIIFRELTAQEISSGAWTGKTELYVLAGIESNLEDNRPIGKWCENARFWGGATGYFPCAMSMVIVSGNFY